MLKIPLHPLSSKFWTLVDDEDNWALSYVWHFRTDDYTYYVYRTLKLDGKWIKKQLHREILDAPPGVQIDHRNGNGLDNRRENLRLATNTQNSYNARRSRRNTSGIKGVSWNKHNQRWEAYIRANGKRRHLGYYQQLEDAAAARTKAELEYHGEFAR
jgi:HNH endonuclease